MEQVTVPAPTVSFAQEDGIYRTKVGQEIHIVPEVGNDTDVASYVWESADGTVLSSEKELVHTWDESGEYFLTFQVTTSGGFADGEVLVIVAALVPPILSLDLPAEGKYVIAEGKTLELSPVVTPEEGTVLEWTVNGEKAGNDAVYIFQAAKPGIHHVKVTATNEDGSSALDFDIDVREMTDLPFSWKFKEEYHASLGRTIHVRPLEVKNASDPVYTWSVDGKEMKKGSEAFFNYKGEKVGESVLTVVLEDFYRTEKIEIPLEICAAEGTYRRKPTAGSKAELNEVYEYLPAPGQFINEGDNAFMTMNEACRYAYEQMVNDRFISLGGFGGYVTVGFDHSVSNDGGYDLQIGGNPFDGSSEPGIVYVMQDENGDGLPNDNWYELKGSEYGKPETIQDYAVEYFRPSGDGMDVIWKDNQGNTGCIEYNQFHSQPSYYPAWVAAASYVLRGTCLKSRTVQEEGIWKNGAFDWGYSDNFSSTDRLQTKSENHFRISDAVTSDGTPANLQYIDFVKVQTGVNASAGIVGEVSTEVFNIKDYNIN